MARPAPTTALRPENSPAIPAHHVPRSGTPAGSVAPAGSRKRKIQACKSLQSAVRPTADVRAPPLPTRQHGDPERLRYQSVIIPSRDPGCSDPRRGPARRSRRPPLGSSPARPAARQPPPASARLRSRGTRASTPSRSRAEARPPAPTRTSRPSPPTHAAIRRPRVRRDDEGDTRVILELSIAGRPRTSAGPESHPIRTRRTVPPAPHRPGRDG